MKVELRPFEVYAIRYATVARKAGENRIGGDPHAAGMEMDYFVWVVTNSAMTFVVDTGFNAEAARRRQRRFLQSPADSLKKLGIEPEHVRQLIVTHLHYDHIGNFDLFPRATFHLQEQEMAYATGKYMASAFFASAYEVDEVTAMVRNVYAGRVVFHNGDADLAPGLTLHHVGGHTRGLQVVRVWTRIGWLVLASDASHYYDNMQAGKPFPIVFNVGDMVDGWHRMQALVDDPAHIIPGHDPLVMQRYRAPAEGMDGEIVRLDDQPQVG